MICHYDFIDSMRTLVQLLNKLLNKSVFIAHYWTIGKWIIGAIKRVVVVKNDSRIIGVFACVNGHFFHVMIDSSSFPNDNIAGFYFLSEHKMRIQK